MRFVLGVLIGAVLTLCVATVFDGPTRALVTRGTSLVDGGSSAWKRFFLATGKAVFPATEDLSMAPVEVPFQMQDQSRLGPDTVSDPEPEAQAAPQSVVEPESLGDVVAVVASDAAPAMQPLAELHSPVRVATHDELVPASNGTEAVWVPFRSQQSAEGFAARLAQKTQHPFQVTRLPEKGPGRYQVTFAYANELQREQLALQIRTATGQVAQ